MTDNYYSTTTFIAYSINRHIYQDQHFTWVASNFYAYGSGNPKSSNPLLIYTDLYQPWMDRDPYDKFILQHRLALRKGIMAKEREGVVAHRIAIDLKFIADRVTTDFFYPIVYALDMNTITPAGRAQVGGSGLSGSQEYFIPDLNGGEFSLLFDDHSDPDFNQMRLPPNHFSSHAHALAILLARS